MVARGDVDRHLAVKQRLGIAMLLVRHRIVVTLTVLDHVLSHARVRIPVHLIIIRDVCHRPILRCLCFIISCDLTVEVHITSHAIPLALACSCIDIPALSSLYLSLVLEIAVLSAEVAHAIGPMKPNCN